MLDADVLDSPGCLILDVRMPGASGLDLQHHLAQNGNPKPIIFLTGHGDIPMTVQAMKAGAVDFLTKPVRDQTLLDAVLAGIAMDAARRAEAAVVKRNVERLETLTPREREVLHEVARGRLNKQIAFDLGISEVTVKLHRGNVMRKMEAASIGELIRAWETLPAPMREPDCWPAFVGAQRGSDRWHCGLAPRRPSARLAARPSGPRRRCEDSRSPVRRRHARPAFPRSGSAS